MKYRAVGGSPVVTPNLCFGGNVFGWTVDEETSFLLLDALRDAGLNFLDTADLYSRWVPGNSGGESEQIIGRWLRSRGGRDRIVIATKVGADLGDGRAGLTARYIKEAVEASLMRLGTDYIDLYQSHFDDLSVPLEETLGAYADLIQAGKVRAIGASNYTAQRFAEALDCSERHGLVRYATFQPHYNLMERSICEAEAAQLCLERGIGVLPFPRSLMAFSPANIGGRRTLPISRAAAASRPISTTGESRFGCPGQTRHALRREPRDDRDRVVADQAGHPCTDRERDQHKPDRRSREGDGTRA